MSNAFEATKNIPKQEYCIIIVIAGNNLFRPGMPEVFMVQATFYSHEVLMGSKRAIFLKSSSGLS